MKVKIIGSGSIRGKYNSACYLIDDDIMIDYPNGASKYLYRENIKPCDINHILLTHLHGDHFFDIPFYVFDKYIAENKNANIYCTRIGEKVIKKLGFLAFQFSFKKHCKKTSVKFVHKNIFNIKDYQIEKYKVSHGHIKNPYGYIITKNNISIGFTGDSSLCNNVEKMAEKCSYLFCDCTLTKGDEKHQGIDNLEYLSKKYPNCIFIASHLGESTRKKIDNKTKNIIKAEDGKEIIIKEKK